MAASTFGIPVTRRSSDVASEFSDGGAGFEEDLVFGFFEEDQTSSENSSENSFGSNDLNDVEEDEDENPGNVEENRAFWEEQERILQGTLYRTSSIETKIRQATKEALREVGGAGLQCVCSRPATGNCRNCLRREVCNRLVNAGYNCAICKSKWKGRTDIPSGTKHILPLIRQYKQFPLESMNWTVAGLWTTGDNGGEHTYLEVLDKSNPKKGDVKVVIELNFRAEFEMARASNEYNRLISGLPEVFVGKSDRLRSLIKILCWAAKKCMKDKKMHLGPWRKHKYMQAKWLGTCERMTPAKFPVGLSDRLPKPRASMLTFDLLETLPGLLRSTAVEVV